MFGLDLSGDLPDINPADFEDDEEEEDLEEE